MSQLRLNDIRKVNGIVIDMIQILELSIWSCFDLDILDKIHDNFSVEISSLGNMDMVGSIVKLELIGLYEVKRDL
ncbi:MAG: hypothetical protein WC554_18710 [Clostridia bacterium]|jgi:hypothetical protein